MLITICSFLNEHHNSFIRVFLLICVISLFASCSQHVITESERLYANTTIKHRQFVEKCARTPAGNGRTSVPLVSIDDWQVLIDQFQRVVELEPDGKNADDALYAIGSCYVWMHDASNETLVLPELPPPTLRNAITAFEKLIEQYPESVLKPDAYYWSGYCYSQLGNYEQAATQYQSIIAKYPDYKNYALSLFRLAECYEKQQLLSAAVATYKAIVENSKEKKIVEQASRKLSVLVSGKPEEDKTKSAITPEKHVLEQSEGIDEQTTSSLVKQLGLHIKTIVIDPGHGGKDPGAVNGTELCEKKITLEIAKKLKRRLDKKYTVYLTREDDTYVTLKGRTEYAKQLKADLFVSIHVNSFSNSQVSGVETYYLSLASDESAKRTAALENAIAEQNINDLESLVTMILKDTKVEESCRLAELVQGSIVNAVKPKNRGVKKAPFIVLIGTKVPAILVETGFISNPSEAKLLSSNSYQEKIASAIADAIERYE